MSVVNKSREKVFALEQATDISSDEKVSRISHYACITCAAVAVQPIPFADIFILTPIQAFFASRIAAIRGVPVTESDANDWIKEIIGMMGMGFLAQQLAIGVWKTVSFGAGGLLTIPLVYGLTYAIMRVADVYFSAKARHEDLSEAQIKAVWKHAFKDGKQAGKQAEQEQAKRDQHEN